MIAGYTDLRSTKNEMKKTTRTQTINPTLGVIRKEPPEAIGRCAVTACISA